MRGERSAHSGPGGSACALLVALCGAMGLAVVPAARAAVSIALTPADTIVAPGDTVDLTLEVTEAGTAFNGFEAVVGYDTPGLAFVPLDPTTDQQGCLMIGTCGGGACGTTFHHFEAAADSLTITDILLCDQVALSGPGAIYHLRFQAAETPQVAQVRIRSATFYEGGLFVGPVVTADAIVRIETSVSVGDRPHAPAAATLRAEPNPARGALVLAIGAPEPGVQRLEAYDLGGRLVRRIEASAYPAGSRRTSWDGRDESGRPVPPGVYVIVLRAAGATAHARVAFVR